MRAAGQRHVCGFQLRAAMGVTGGHEFANRPGTEYQVERFAEPGRPIDRRRMSRQHALDAALTFNAVATPRGMGSRRHLAEHDLKGRVGAAGASRGPEAPSEIPSFRMAAGRAELTNVRR